MSNLNPDQFGRHIEISEAARQEMLAASSAGQRAAEMHNHAQQTPADLSSPHDLKHHVMTAHEWDDNDLLTNSHWRDISHVVHTDDYDREMSHNELRRVHDDEHRAHPHDYPRATTLGDSHFHDA